MLRPHLENSLRPLHEGLSGILGDLEEGLNRRGVRNLRQGHRLAVGGGFGGITGQSDEDSTVRDIGQLMGRREGIQTR